MQNLPRRRAALGLAAAAACSLGVPLLAAAQTRKLRVGHLFAVDHPVHLGLNKAAKALAASTRGRLQLEIFPSGQLGNAREMLSQVMEGSLDMTTEGAGALSQLHRPLSIFEAAFVARNFDHLLKMIASPHGQQQLLELTKSRGLVSNIDVWYYGVRHFTTGKVALRTPADAKGLKLRVPEIGIFLDMVRSIGATPTPMALAEVYLALQTGVVDGQENPLATINNQKFFEVQKYLNLTGHVIVPYFPTVAVRTWNDLSTADKSTFTAAMKEGGAENDRVTRGLESTLVEQFRKTGMQIVESDTASFRAAMQSIYPRYEAVWGSGVYAQMAAIK